MDRTTPTMNDVLKEELHSEFEACNANDAVYYQATLDYIYALDQATLDYTHALKRWSGVHL